MIRHRASRARTRPARRAPRPPTRPADLAKRIQKAIAAKNMDALAAEVDQFATLTGMEQFALLDIVVDCQTGGLHDRRSVRCPRRRSSG